VQVVETVQPVEIVQQPIVRQTPNMFAGMDPMMMMMLLSDEDSSMKDLLPLIMMQQQGQGGAFTGQNGMNPLFMLTLLDDDACEVNANVKLFTDLTTEEQKSIARGDYFYTATTDAPAGVTSMTDTDIVAFADIGTINIDEDRLNTLIKYIDYEFISCEEKLDSSSLSDILPLMMMGQKNMQTMDPMMLMMLIDDESNDLSLPMLMSMQGMNSGTQANPLLWLTLLDDSTLTKKQCDAKYALPYIFKWEEVPNGAADNEFFTITKATGDDIRDVVADYEKQFDNSGVDLQIYAEHDQFLADYFKCFDEATKEGGDKIDDLLPLMMMNGGFGGQANGQMDPLLMMSLLDSDSDSDSDKLLPLLMMQQGGMNGMNNGQIDPMMMMLLLKD